MSEGGTPPPGAAGPIPVAAECDELAPGAGERHDTCLKGHVDELSYSGAASRQLAETFPENLRSNP